MTKYTKTDWFVVGGFLNALPMLWVFDWVTAQTGANPDLEMLALSYLIIGTGWGIVSAIATLEGHGDEK